MKVFRQGGCFFGILAILFGTISALVPPRFESFLIASFFSFSFGLA
jgi:hypothetical protein